VSRRHVALIGRPLRRRHSQVMHDAAFAANGIDARYELREIEPDELPAFVAEVRDPGWFGFQVTAPYKQAIMELLDEIEPEARAIGAVNSVERRGDGALVGFNTDAPGVARAVERDLGLGFAGAVVVVAGAGGAARAVAHAALGGGASELLVAARRVEQAEGLAGGLDSRAGAIALEDPALAGALARADLVVNATTVGMLEPGTVVDAAALGERTAVFDLVYVPPETELVRRARERGLNAASGAEMLVAQAEIAFGRWTGVEGSATVMREAVDPLIQAGGPA
jgi:shikimate dehydrogenase